MSYLIKNPSDINDLIKSVSLSDVMSSQKLDQMRDNVLELLDAGRDVVAQVNSQDISFYTKHSFF